MLLEHKSENKSPNNEDDSHRPPSRHVPGMLEDTGSYFKRFGLVCLSLVPGWFVNWDVALEGTGLLFGEFGHAATSPACLLRHSWLQYHAMRLL